MGCKELTHEALPEAEVGESSDPESTVEETVLDLDLEG